MTCNIGYIFFWKLPFLALFVCWDFSLLLTSVSSSLLKLNKLPMDTCHCCHAYPQRAFPFIGLSMILLKSPYEILWFCTNSENVQRVKLEEKSWCVVVWKEMVPKGSGTIRRYGLVSIGPCWSRHDLAGRSVSLWRQALRSPIPKWCSVSQFISCCLWIKM